MKRKKKKKKKKKKRQKYIKTTKIFTYKYVHIKYIYTLTYTILEYVHVSKNYKTKDKTRRYCKCFSLDNFRLWTNRKLETQGDPEKRRNCFTYDLCVCVRAGA